MTFQIRAIHLFNYQGERHTLPFRLDRLNVITGASARGKSSVLDIVSYCLGSADYPVPAGVIRDTVAFYALELETSDGVLLVARPAPQEKRSVSTQMHLSFRGGSTAGAPELAELALNSDVDSAVQRLSLILGIGDNLTDVGGGSRRSYAATVRHALYFVLQAQDEVASPDLLFHGQNEEWVPQSIRDVLPFFLGVVDPFFVLKQDQLRAKERSLRALQKRAADERAISEPNDRARLLAVEAAAVGLMEPAGDMTQAELVEALFGASRTGVGAEGVAPVLGDGLLGELLEQREGVRTEHDHLRREISRLRSLVRYESDFAGEAGEQHARLSSLGLLRIGNEVGAADTCPICDSILPDPVTDVDQIRRSLERVASEIQDVGDELPRLQAILGENELRLAELADRLRLNQLAIDQATATQELFASLRDQSLQRAAVRGRISLYLESVNREVESAFLDERIAELAAEIEELRADLDADAAAERLASALSRISHSMTDFATDLKLEHSPAPARLDIRNLTVVVDTAGGSYRLNQIGSGENWVGYHIATLLALHEHFLEERRPVPRFLVLDQPSQVYFPPDVSFDSPDITDDDRDGIRRIYTELNTFVHASGGFQIIVLDHADLQDDWFQDSVIQRWRGEGEGLVPASWVR
ncbi:DUF3732 domain-containing protein [Kribbella sp. NPDC051620]|uniref:DUF3732 domain-containing protein n=1 Tax=Kribbella sp. NPDC051620 TaxID=3364120 RepID=UPI00378A646A